MIPPQKSVAEMGLLTIADWEPLAGISRTAGKETLEGASSSQGL